MAAAASYHHHRPPHSCNNNSNNHNPGMPKKTDTSQLHASQSSIKLSPDKLELIKNSQQHYSTVLNAIRRGNLTASGSSSAAGPVAPFLFPGELAGSAAALQHDPRYAYAEQINGQLRPDDEEEESQDIDLMDGDTESGTKIDVESDSDEGHPHIPDNEIKNLRQSAFLQHPESVPRLLISDRSAEEMVSRGQDMSPAKDYEEATTDLEFEMFNKKRKYSSVKGFSIENIMGHNRSDGS